MNASSSSNDSDSSSDSSQSSSLSVSTVPLVFYELNGSFKIKSPIYLKDLSEINRRASIIMACHLFHEAPDSCWKSFRASVASDIFKRMSTFEPRDDSENNNNNGCISSWRLLIDSKSYVIDDEMVQRWSADDEYKAKARGCLEMVVAKQFIVVVAYNLAIECDTVRISHEGFKIVPEPHYSWAELIEDVDKTHGTDRKFSGSLADRALSSSDRCSPTISYVHYDQE